MIAIQTKYLCATASRGSRIKAYAYGYKSVTVPYPHEFSVVACHFEAVKAFVKRNGLDVDLRDMRYGDSADGKGWCFCFASSIV